MKLTAQYYLTPLQYALATTASFTAISEQCAQPPDWKHMPLNHPLYALYVEYGLEDQLPIPFIEHASMWSDLLIPASDITMCDLGILALDTSLEHEHQRSQILYMLYCHETGEPSIYLTPSLKLKKLLKLKKTIPFSVSHQGSTALVGALDLLDSLYTEENRANGCKSILLTVDQLAPPQPRYFFDNFPKGDSAFACFFSPHEGRYSLLNWKYCSHPVPACNPYSYTPQEFSSLSHTFYESLNSKIKSFLALHSLLLSDINLVIPQQLSQDFHQAIEKLVEGACPIFQRTNVQQINLLNSDVLFSLAEADESNKLKHNDLILLITAGPLCELGLILLQRNQ